MITTVAELYFSRRRDWGLRGRRRLWVLQSRRELPFCKTIPKHRLSFSALMITGVFHHLLCTDLFAPEKSPERKMLKTNLICMYFLFAHTSLCASPCMYSLKLPSWSLRKYDWTLYFFKKTITECSNNVSMEPGLWTTGRTHKHTSSRSLCLYSLRKRLNPVIDNTHLLQEVTLYVPFLFHFQHRHFPLSWVCVLCSALRLLGILQETHSSHKLERMHLFLFRGRSFYRATPHIRGPS